MNIARLGQGFADNKNGVWEVVMGLVAWVATGMWLVQ
jgi:hypothetical protein